VAERQRGLESERMDPEEYCKSTAASRGARSTSLPFAELITLRARQICAIRKDPIGIRAFFILADAEVESS
jgi:hypothetical protein